MLDSTLMVGTSGVETDMEGASGKLIVGTEGVESGRLMVGTVTAQLWFTSIEGESGKLIVGIGVATSFESEQADMLCLCLAGLLSKIDRLRSSGLSSASLGFQFLSKLTIGRPGLSLTTVGVGSLGLRSFKRMLVACRISSLLISRPSLVSFSGNGGLSEAGSGSDVFGGGGFEVYAGFLDWDGGLRWISDIESFLMGSGGVLFERGIRSWAN